MGHLIPTRTVHLPLNMSVNVLNTTQRKMLLLTTGGERDIFHITVLSTSIYFIEYYIYKVAV